MSSIFTAPGTNAANAQQQEQHQAAQQSSGLLNSYTPYVQNQINFQKQQQPVAQAAINGLGNFTTQGGRNQEVSWYGQNARGNAQTAASQTPGQFAGNSALSNAYQMNAYNQANQATNQYSQQVNSPQGQQQAYQSYLGGLQSQSPDFNGMASLTGNVYGQPQVQVGQGLLGYLSSVAGDAAQVYTGKGK